MNYCFEGDIYSENVFDIKKDILNQIDTSKEVVLDFKNVNYIDSTGLGLLVSIHKKTVDTEHLLKLIHVNDDIKRIFSITMLDTLFSINENHE